MHIKAETAVGLFVITALGALFYMSFQIGFMRVDKARYALYIAQFKDSAGLSKKAEIKIAGIKVGWVDTIALNADGNTVTVHLMVLKKYRVFQNAHAFIRQEGILGGKYVELCPGQSDLPRLTAGSILTQVCREQVSLDELCTSFKKVAQTVHDMGAVLRVVLDTQAENNILATTLHACKSMADKMALLSERLEKLTAQNQETLTVLVRDTQTLVANLKERIPAVTDSLGQLTNTLAHTVVPRVTQQCDTLTATINNSFTHIDQVVQKVNQGTGFLGKLLTEERAAMQLQQAVGSLHRSLNTLDKLSFAVDGHIESLHSSTGNTGSSKIVCSDFKGYARVKMQPADDYFFLAGLVSWQRGFIKRTSGYCTYIDGCFDKYKKGHTAFTRIQRHRDSFALDLQVGKIFNNIAVRFGIFEGTAGCAIDYHVPFTGEYYKWVTSLEIFDITGRTRVNYAPRPQVKWLNKVYIGPNAYLVFGAYDSMGKYRKSFFLGAGIRFGDDYRKYATARNF